MNRRQINCIAVAALAVVMLLACCKNVGVETRQIAGTLEGPMPSDTVPEHIRQAMDKASRYHNQDLMNDEASEIAVSAISMLSYADTKEETSTEGYGIVVSKKAASVTFPYIRHTRQPIAKYNAKTGDLWLTSSAMEGTGVHVDWLYQIRFGEDDMAFVKTKVNPYEVQQELLKRLGYTLDGDNIAIYDGKKLLSTVTNTVKDMGGFDDEQPLWIGEQLYYDLTGDEPKVVFSVGVKFTTGLVLTYDDMPEMTAPITIDENGSFTIREIYISSAANN